MVRIKGQAVTRIQQQLAQQSLTGALAERLTADELVDELIDLLLGRGTRFAWHQAVGHVIGRRRDIGERATVHVVHLPLGLGVQGAGRVVLNARQEPGDDLHQRQTCQLIEGGWLVHVGQTAGADLRIHRVGAQYVLEHLLAQAHQSLTLGGRAGVAVGILRQGGQHPVQTSAQLRRARRTPSDGVSSKASTKAGPHGDRALTGALQQHVQNRHALGHLRGFQALPHTSGQITHRRAHAVEHVAYVVLRKAPRRVLHRTQKAIAERLRSRVAQILLGNIRHGRILGDHLQLRVQSTSRFDLHSCLIACQQVMAGLQLQRTTLVAVGDGVLVVHQAHHALLGQLQGPQLITAGAGQLAVLQRALYALFFVLSCLRFDLHLEDFGHRRANGVLRSLRFGDTLVSGLGFAEFLQSFGNGARSILLDFGQVALGNAPHRRQRRAKLLLGDIM